MTHQFPNYRAGDGSKTAELLCWTNYPLDIRRPKGTAYPVRVLAYDGNKYVLIRSEHDGRLYTVKSGYLSTDASCLECLPAEEFRHIKVSYEEVWENPEEVLG